ncbi:MAG: cysteine desulfurase [Planctomycetes bacterium]|nr:cysteine desulfurase [Planctomycetota bacterium]
MRTIYLDYAASAPLFPGAAERFAELAAEVRGNPDSRHSDGRRAREILENARARLAAILDVPAADFYFTSGATESNNLAIKGLPGAGRIVTTRAEHSSILGPVFSLEEAGWQATYLDVDESGRAVLQGAGGREKGAGGREQGEGSREQGEGSREQGEGSREKGAGRREQGEGRREQGEGVKSLDPRPSILDPRPSILDPRPSILDPRSSILDPSIVALSLANSETGALSDVDAVARAFPDSVVYIDAAQAFCRIEVQPRKLDADMLGVSSHKVGGPAGIGGLYVRSGLRLRPLLHGGGQQRGIRPGTENAILAALFSDAAEYTLSWFESLPRYRRPMLEALAGSGLDFRVNTPLKAAPHILSVSFQGFSGRAIADGLDKLGVSVSTGSACSEQGESPSHVLLAMGRTEDEARSTIRLSFGPGISRADVDDAIKKVIEVVRELGRIED